MIYGDIVRDSALQTGAMPDNQQRQLELCSICGVHKLGRNELIIVAQNRHSALLGHFAKLIQLEMSV